MATMAPVAPMPTVSPVVPVPAVMPVDLLRLDVIDFVLRHDRGFDVCGRLRWLGFGRNRRNGSGLRDRGQCRSARQQSGTELEKFTAFHDVSFLEVNEGAQSRRCKMNAG